MLDELYPTGLCGPPEIIFCYFQMVKNTLKSAPILESPQPNFVLTREKRWRYLEISKINSKKVFFEFLRKNEVPPPL